MREFSFYHPDFKKSSLDRQRFYQSNFDKPITEEQFVAEVGSWPKKELHNSQSRSPSKARSDYRRLVRNYGFFPPVGTPTTTSLPSGSEDVDVKTKA